MTFDPSQLDLNTVLRKALHERGTDEEIEPYLRTSVAEAVPTEAVDSIHAGIARAVQRVQSELGGSPGDALHTLAANLRNYHFDFDDEESGSEAAPSDRSWIVQGEGLVRLGDLDAEHRKRLRARVGTEHEQSTTPAPPAPSKSGCLGLLAVVVAAAVWLT